MSNNTYDGIIFDLDGTLLDTLQDIALAANAVLREHGWPTHPVDAYRLFVGGGIGHLMESASPEAEPADGDVDGLLAHFRDVYGNNWRDNTRPYPGITDMLDAVTNLGVRMSILSNKPDPFTKEFVAELLPNWKFEKVFGSRPGVPKKPDPTSALEIAQSTSSPEKTMFVGDSGVDMQTALAAGMFPVGVLWGFRSRPELEAGGAKTLIEHPRELPALLS